MGGKDSPSGVFSSTNKGGVGVKVGVGVEVGSEVSVGVGVLVDVRVGLEVRVEVDVGISDASNMENIGQQPDSQEKVNMERRNTIRKSFLITLEISTVSPGVPQNFWIVTIILTPVTLQRIYAVLGLY